MKSQSVFAIALMLMSAPALGQATANVLSDGEGQQIIVDQGAAGLDSRVSVDQIGFANVTQVTQQNAANFADIRVDGSDNDLTAIQSGDGEHTVLLNTQGNANTALTDQSGEIGGANDASIFQTGTSNKALVIQNSLPGVVNLATLNQTGDDNDALLSQTGAGNTINLIQNGNGNSADLSQTGVDLGISIEQTGGASITVSQGNF